MNKALAAYGLLSIVLIGCAPQDADDISEQVDAAGERQLAGPGTRLEGRLRPEERLRPGKKEAVTVVPRAPVER